MDFLSNILNPYYLQIFMFFLINAIMGISVYFTLSSGQLTLGAAGFMSVGAYGAALLSLKAGIPIPVAIIIGGLMAAALAAVIGFPTTRLQGLYLAIATLGFGEVIRVIFLNLEITNGALGLAGIPSMGNELSKILYSIGIDTIGGIDNQSLSDLMVVFILIGILALVTFFCIRIKNSRVGRAFDAIKADEHAAELMGINVVYYKMAAFIIGAFIAGIGGGLFAHVTNYITPGDFSYHRVVDILLFCVFGGSNVVWGSILGAFVLTLMPEVLRFLADYQDIIYGILLVVLMTFRSDGVITEDTMAVIQNYFNKKKAKKNVEPEKTEEVAKEETAIKEEKDSKDSNEK